MGAAVVGQPGFRRHSFFWYKVVSLVGWAWRRFTNTHTHNYFEARVSAAVDAGGRLVVMDVNRCMCMCELLLILIRKLLSRRVQTSICPPQGICRLDRN